MALFGWPWPSHRLGYHSVLLSCKFRLVAQHEELRKLAAARLAQEKPGQTLQATALVHEAYLRLVGPASARGEPLWHNRGHFFAAAAEAMRRILVDNARRKNRLRHGGNQVRIELDAALPAAAADDDSFLDLNEAIDNLAAVSPQAAELVKLRYFVGLTGREAAEVLQVSPRKADQIWAYARAWLLERLADKE